MSSARDIFAFVADQIGQKDILWNIFSKTIVRLSQYLCQERRNVEARRVVATDPLLYSILKDAKVMGGPFQGMMYGETSSFCSAYYPKILGTYEVELIVRIKISFFPNSASMQP
jgi:hypothetical protein